MAQSSQIALQKTKSSNVYILDTAMWMPQLQRSRQINIYLPATYYTSKKIFPVIYMHDGQNIFDKETSFAGEWGIDEYLNNATVQQSIVVAINNGGTKRINEYLPYQISQKSSIPENREILAEGDQYVDFIVKTLKPLVDKKFRTLRKKDNTTIIGASMGGLISFYAALKYPKVFGNVGVFSPSFWMGTDKLASLVEKRGRKVKSDIYFYCGKQEGSSMVADMLLFLEKMAKVSKSNMTTVIREDGQHNEASWQKEFPAFYQWINVK